MVLVDEYREEYIDSDEAIDLLDVITSSPSSEHSQGHVPGVCAEEDQLPNHENGLSRGQTATKVENTIISFLRQLKACGELDGQSVVELCLRDRTKGYSAAVRSMRLPARTKTFAQLMSVLSSIHEAVVTDMPVTKRDIYYQDINLFRTQSTVDRLVDDIGATFEVSRAQLNVRASPKGLFLGSGLTMHLVSGLPITGNDSEATIVPQNEDISRCVVDSDVRWVLILEKEAVFQTLSRSSLVTAASHPSLGTLGRGILITGKGYPDVATRKLVNQLANDLPTNVPILALVDWDPHGIDILLTYKLGSISMLHEKDTLAASRVQWLGIYSSDVLNMEGNDDLWIDMTIHDRKKALAILERGGETSPPPEMRRELEHMLLTGRKAEIEIIASSSSNTSVAERVDKGCGQDTIVEGTDTASMNAERRIINHSSNTSSTIGQNGQTLNVHPLTDYVSKKVVLALGSAVPSAITVPHV